MGKKKKKKILQKINPEKSNKMIYAVGIGLVVVFACFFLLTTSGTSPKNKKEFMSSALKYLKKTEGVLDVMVFPEKNRVKIIYDRNDQKDFRKIARFAGIKISLKLKKENVEVVLYRENEQNQEYNVVFKNGEIVRENQ